jgi:hypothetical protein
MRVPGWVSLLSLIRAWPQRCQRGKHPPRRRFPDGLDTAIGDLSLRALSIPFSSRSASANPPSGHREDQPADPIPGSEQRMVAHRELGIRCRRFELCAQKSRHGLLNVKLYGNYFYLDFCSVVITGRNDDLAESHARCHLTSGEHGIPEPGNRAAKAACGTGAQG